MARKPQKHLIHGEWMTIYEISDRLGVAVGTIRQWRKRHRHRDGSAATMAEAWDWYTGVALGKIRHRGPSTRAREYWVNGRYMTIAEAASQVGVSEEALRSMMYKGRRTLQSAVRHYEHAQKDRAVREILDIIYNG